MPPSERRRSVRHTVDYPGKIFLGDDRSADVRIINLGQLGALVTMADLEEAVLEGERVMLEHPVLEDGEPAGETARTVGAVLRVELEFSEGGISRHLAVYFDGGPPPEGAPDA